MKGESVVDDDVLFVVDDDDVDGDEVGLVDDVVDWLFGGFWVEESGLFVGVDVDVVFCWLFATEGVLILNMASHLTVIWGLHGSHSLFPT